MSWDIGLSGTSFWRNYTHNMNGALVEALSGKDWWDFEGMVAEEAIPQIQRAIERLESEPDSFRHFEPENKWGRVETLVDFLKDCLKAMEDNPESIIRVSG